MKVEPVWDNFDHVSACALKRINKYLSVEFIYVCSLVGIKALAF